MKFKFIAKMLKFKFNKITKYKVFRLQKKWVILVFPK